MSATANVESEGVSKVQVKRQIKTIVDDLENILGDLKDVAKELKEVVHEIDSLTSDLQLEEDSSKTDTLNSSSSSTTTTTTASSIEKVKIYPEDTLLRPPPSTAAGVLTVLKRPHPPLPPPRLTPARVEDRGISPSSGNLARANGTLMRNGVLPAKPLNVPGRDSARGPKNATEKGLTPMPLLRHEKSRCPQVPRERVRFSEKVQYHGYCPDCDLQYDMSNTDMHLHAEFVGAGLSPIHQCSALSPTHVLMENGGLSLSRSFPPSTPPCVPHHSSSQKPQKTILRKSTTTTRKLKNGLPEDLKKQDGNRGRLACFRKSEENKQNGPFVREQRHHSPPALPSSCDARRGLVELTESPRNRYQITYSQRAQRLHRRWGGNRMTKVEILPERACNQDYPAESSTIRGYV